MLAACSSDSGAAASSEKTEEEITEPEQIEENSDAAAETDLVQSLVQRVAEGMTMHVTVYADGEEMYSYDYAMLGQKYCIDRIGGIHNDHYDYDICRIVFNPDLYELPVLWYGAPVSDGIIEITEQYQNTAFLWDSDYLSQTGDMEFEFSSKTAILSWLFIRMMMETPPLPPTDMCMFTESPVSMTERMNRCLRLNRD